MDIALFIDTRFTVMYGMLFASILLMTAQEPAAVPAVFLKIWRHYKIYQELNKKRSPKKQSHDFWEIDMTDFEP